MDVEGRQPHACFHAWHLSAAFGIASLIVAWHAQARPDQPGFLASYSEFVAVAQENLRISKENNRLLTDIRDTLTPQDAKEKLAKKSIPLDSAHYKEALYRADQEVVRLFLEAKFHPNTDNAFNEVVPKSSDPVAVCKLVNSFEKIDWNKPFTIAADNHPERMRGIMEIQRLAQPALKQHRPKLSRITKRQLSAGLPKTAEPVALKRRLRCVSACPRARHFTSAVKHHF